jgi:mannose-6-phosphate isomerase class I
VDALRIFDYTAWPLAAVQAHFRVAPEALAANEGLQEQRRIGPKQIDCFDVREIEVDSAAQYDLKGRFALGIMVAGKGRILYDGEELAVRRGSCFLLAAAAGLVQMEPAGAQALQILLCLPGAA